MLSLMLILIRILILVPILVSYEHECWNPGRKHPLVSWLPDTSNTMNANTKTNKNINTNTQTNTNTSPNPNPPALCFARASRL